MVVPPRTCERAVYAFMMLPAANSLHYSLAGSAEAVTLHQVASRFPSLHSWFIGAARASKILAIHQHIALSEAGSRKETP